jgi:pimeloyl-ACP methyl ester carboxylesterase
VRQSLSRLVVISALALLAGCAAPLQNSPDQIRAHVLVVDGKGLPHDPYSPNADPFSMPQYRTRLDDIFTDVATYFKNKPDKKTILIFIHGGLNSPDDSLSAADLEMQNVIAAGYYPIYIDWNSDIWNTYGEHIVSLTQGRTDNTIIRWLFTPAYVLADIGRAATRMPIVYLNEFASDLQAASADLSALKIKNELASSSTFDTAPNQRWATGAHGQALAQVYQQLHKDSQPHHLRIWVGPDLDVDAGHMTEIGAFYVLTLPTKIITQPIIDWLGFPAWQVMSRRTQLCFDGALGGNAGELSSFDLQSVGDRATRATTAPSFDTTGAVDVFRQRLQAEAKTNGYDIILVGHSMGTMVLNEWLRRDILESKEQVYSNIVYMAAACSVRDFSRSVVPYLQQHKQTNFYSLMLNPTAELLERRRGYDIPPRGSLLVWLDDFLDEPQAPLDRTFGRWDNIIPAIDVIPKEIRGQIMLKAFALAPDDSTAYGPQEHDQFRSQPYWCQSFWSDESAQVSQPCK